MNGGDVFAIGERLLSRGPRAQWHAEMDMRRWYPLSVGREPARICWRHLGEQRFTDSFFADTLARQPREQRLVCETPLAALAKLGDCLEPDAFIFHVSRCGSTLLAQMLASLPHCVVMSEPPAVDSLLRLHHEAPGRHDAPALLRQLIRALGQRRFAEESNFIVKFDSWHIHSLALIRQAFPDTPCLFLYREPRAVLASHRRQRGPQMVPGLVHPALLPLPPRPVAAADLDAYTGKVLESFYSAAATHAQAGLLKLINYSQLPALVPADLLPALGIVCTGAQREAMLARTGFHSKSGGDRYQGDPDRGDAARLDSIAALIEPFYSELEQIRMTQVSTRRMS